MNAQLTASSLGLIITGADWSMCWKDEKRIIWTSPFRITAASFLYIVTNYLSIVFHATDVGIASFGRIKYPHGAVPYGVCLVQFLFKAIGICSLGALLHLILMLRVYALYTKCRFMAAFLVLAFVGRTAAIIGIFSHYDDLSEYRSPFDHAVVGSSSICRDYQGPKSRRKTPEIQLSPPLI
ncbi:hypothetical protein PM082_022764 [Marasmius tenuissimus]|nr:hypothetical protein PM082_022764 [Marasmius tenuissimus]